MTPIVGNIKDVDVVADCLDRYGSDVLAVLLKDRTTGKNIIWADDEYVKLGEGYGAYDEITVEKIGTGKLIEPRVAKAAEQQAWRTKEKAEVFTPSWLCKKMVDCLDDAFFGGEPAGFEADAETGLTDARIELLAEGERWKEYVANRLLEITCGEAPFICSPYVATTGELIPVSSRVGFLDRKLRVVGRFASTYDEWLEWAIEAAQSSYGYEYQGDNLLIARINVLNTFADFMQDMWGKAVEECEAKRVADIVSWNLWQMDGLRGCVPSEWDLPPEKNEADSQMSLFDMGLFGEEITEEEDSQTQMQFADKCTIYDWQANTPLDYEALSEGIRGSMGKVFYAIIGNPPYQEDLEGTSASQIYPHFMDESYKIGDKVELITPARFLFNAGKTSKAWNEKMLADPHLKVLDYEQKSDVVFPNTDIKGGVAVTYRDAARKIGPIIAYSAYPELNHILAKVKARMGSESLDDWIVQQNRWNLDALYGDRPEYRQKIGSGGRERRLTTSIFALDVFSEERRSADDVAVLGLVSNRRFYRYVKRSYLDPSHENLEKYKVIVPASNGSGAIGEVLSTPLIGSPLIGYTQSFIAFGALDSPEEAEALLKYIKSKFARTLLGTLKVTQHNHKGTWVNVPLQDFTSSSDIDWSQSVEEVDAQLYAKYGLSREEIDFIESHVKEMS